MQTTLLCRHIVLSTFPRMKRPTTSLSVNMSRATSLTALFDSLAGTWVLNRDLQSANTNEPSGKCHGTATLTPRQPSPVLDKEGKRHLADAEMLYHEIGEFQLPSNVKMPFSKKYVWQLKKEGDQDAKVSVWFTKPGTDAVDYLFHMVDVKTGEEGDQVQGNGGHLCIDDFYSTQYNFKVEGDSNRVISWETVHEVRGPKKDQLLTTTFTKG